ncbi:MAG: methyltransferase domain-containing protein [Pirellulaceae bacterium]|nr:methyltransferase domain-containing protein [Pirellulaceae bacterium]
MSSSNRIQQTAKGIYYGEATFNQEKSDLQLGQYIPLHYHYAMLLDEHRMSSFQQAIQQVVRPGARVLELGGGTGVLSFFAAQQGASVDYVEYLPEMCEAANDFFLRNGVHPQVTIHNTDARTFLPDEPVDVVICEMLHSAVLSEKQLEIIHLFKEAYARKFGSLPVFIPEATLLGVQPTQHDFVFEGFYAPVPIFQLPSAIQPRTLPLADPVVYLAIMYDEPFSQKIQWNGTLKANKSGVCNAIRFITKNILTISVEEQTTVEWSNQHMVLPLSQALFVEEGDQFKIAFSYKAGDPIQALSKSLKVTWDKETTTLPISANQNQKATSSQKPKENIDRKRAA